MRTAYISHLECLEHDTGEGHPESSVRLSAIEDRLIASGLRDVLMYIDAPEVTDEQLLRVHTPEYLKLLESKIPEVGHANIDDDTVISPRSLKAAKRAAGANVKGVDLVMNGEFDSTFCCVRPPGHHAESNRSLGFCLYNNVGVGAAHALEKHGLKKVAIIDFDVHQGNGTEEIFQDDKRVLFCSTFQHPFYPSFEPVPENTENRVNVPLDATAKSEEFRAAVTDHWMPALRKFEPEMIFISAGFDAHRDDEMSHVSLSDDDFHWVTEQLVQIAGETASNRIVSSLEGGYEIYSLARCVGLHIRALMQWD